jgi:hypothetical protein
MALILCGKNVFLHILFKDQLTEAKECLQAASRLTEQLERKSERIEQLNKEGTNINRFMLILGRILFLTTFRMLCVTAFNLALLLILLSLVLLISAFP